MKKMLLVVMLGLTVFISSCSIPGVSVKQVTTLTPTITDLPTNTATVAPPTAAPTVTPVPPTKTVIPPTSTATARVVKYENDLFDASNGLCFVVNATPVNGMHRVLEFLYGSRVSGDTIKEYKPTERGTDKNTWPSWVILVNARTSRPTSCGEVEARHPILYRIAPVKSALDVQWEFSMDSADNSEYDAAYKAASVKSNNLGLFIGSNQGIDVDIQIFDADGKQIDLQHHHVAGAYCNDCVPGTAIEGNKAQYVLTPQAFEFESSNRHTLTTDVLALKLPKDFDGKYVITIHAGEDTVTDLWLGELNPLTVTPTSTPTPTFTK